MVAERSTRVLYSAAPVSILLSAGLDRARQQLGPRRPCGAAIVRSRERGQMAQLPTAQLARRLLHLEPLAQWCVALGSALALAGPATKTPTQKVRTGSDKWRALRSAVLSNAKTVPLSRRSRAPREQAKRAVAKWPSLKCSKMVLRARPARCVCWPNCSGCCSISQSKREKVPLAFYWRPLLEARSVRPVEAPGKRASAGEHGA